MLATPPGSIFSGSEQANRYLVERLKEVPMKAVSRPSSSLAASDRESGLWDVATGHIFYRDAEGHLSRRDPNGNVTTFSGPKASDRQGLSAQVNCYNTGRDLPRDECSNFMHDCLLNDDSTGAAECLANYYQNALAPEDAIKADIARIHPVIAYRILQKFGFRYRHEYDDVAKGKLKKVEKVSHWKENVYANMSANDKRHMENVLNNDRMETYLAYLVAFVNANPAILNERYTGKAEEAVSGVFRQPDYLNAIGVVPQKPPRYGDKVALSVRARQPRKLRMLPAFGHGVLGMPMSASASNWNHDFHQFVTVGQSGGFQVSTEQTGGAGSDVDYLEGVLKVAINRLADQGKEINAADQAKIEDNIKAWKNAKAGAERMVSYVEAYGRLLELVGDQEYASEVVNIDTMKQLVDKYNRVHDTQMSYEERLNKVLVALEESSGSDQDNYRTL